MKLSEAREFIDRLYNSEDGMTDDMREDLRRLHDSEDEQEGMERYWKEMSDKMDGISNKMDGISNAFRDFKRDYVTRVLTGRDAVKKHVEDLKDDDFDNIEDETEKIKSIFNEEVIEK